MKKLYIKALASLLIGGSMVSCGDDFLDAKVYEGVDTETALNSVTNIGYAVNGCYDRLYRYYFAGNYATSFGDIASDVTYWNGKTSHFTNIYQFSPVTTDTYLSNIWNYGYKVIDNSSRAIVAGEAMMANVSEEEKADLEMYLAEAYALRAYGHFVLVNIFGHQIKVNGQDFSSQPGIVVVESPVVAGSQVSRATVGETYASIVSDLKKSILNFESAGQSKGVGTYFNPAAAHGLLSRVYLYMENFSESIVEADAALAEAGITSLTYTPASYKALYNGEGSNSESFFYLGIDPSHAWSANSCGTLWTTYSYSPSPWLQSVMADTDVRRAVWSWDAGSSPEVPIFGSGKFGAYGLGGNPAYGTNYLINAPEMFLNKAESYIRQAAPDVNAAKDALLVVAKRNTAITSVADLNCSTADDVMNFIKDERARELFQEGFRLYDLRRWDVKANLYAYKAPAIDWTYKNVKVSDCVYPIPAAEINAGFGVKQTEGWESTFPSM